MSDSCARFHTSFACSLEEHGRHDTKAKPESLSSCESQPPAVVSKRRDKGIFAIAMDKSVPKFILMGARLLRAATAGILIAFASSRALAAEIKVDPSVPNGLGAVLEGRIEAGDFERILQFIEGDHHFAHLYLASPGGNLIEAIRIGSLLRQLRVSTTIPSKPLTRQSWLATVTLHDLKVDRADYQCAGACFFIFVAGIYRAHEGAQPAILGIHEPSVSAAPSVKANPQQLAAAAKRGEAFTGAYLKAMGVPSQYLIDMYSTPPNYVRWIRNDEFEKDFAGIIPELKHTLAIRCELTEPQEKQVACETKFQEDLSRGAYEKVHRATGTL